MGDVTHMQSDVAWIAAAKIERQGKRLSFSLLQSAALGS